MSIISGIFPSEIVDIDESGLPIYDRAVDEEYFAKYHSEFLSNGVYANPSNNFQVMANELMKLKVKAGSCFINGYYAYDNFDGEITLEPASSDLNRIDRIVTRLDRINRKISIEVKKGAYGTTSYSAPSLQRDDDIWELGLADVLVKKGTTQIVQANITDLRAIQEYCGYVYNPMQNIDTTDLFAQYDNSFEVWFQHVKDQLSTDAAGNLQKQIDTHTSQLADKQNKNDTNLTTVNKTIVGSINELNTYKADKTIEELGWWTPVLYCGGDGNKVITANTSGSYYQKIGNVVTCYFYIGVSNWDSSWASQALLIRGVPFLINKSLVEIGVIGTYAGLIVSDSHYGVGLSKHGTSGGAISIIRQCQSSNEKFPLQLAHLNQSFVLRGNYTYRI